MNDPARGAPRTLAAIIALGIAAHGVLTGCRVVASLEALSRGASAFTVGVLMALFALLPMVFSVAAGRLSDRVGIRPPMLLGFAVVGVGALLPFALPGLPSLFASATLIGMGFVVFQLAAQNATGELGGPAERARNFSLLALGYSVSGFFGPLAAGFAIDHAGFRVAFGLFALVTVVPTVALARGWPALPGRHAHAAQGHHGGVRALLRHRTLRRVLAVNALLSLGWDLHTIFVPIYGAKIGLSASQIGIVLSSFAAATFAVRFSMPAISRRMSEHQILHAALVLAGCAYLVFPFSTSVTGLVLLSAVLGLGLGSGQPMVMALLHTHAPPGRMGEAAGVRMSLVQSMAVAVPLVFGAVGSSVGITPVFWSVGAFLVAGGVLARRAGR